MTTNRHSRLRQRGFTLIELIVVMSIIVLVLAVILPVVNSLNSGRSLQNAQNQVGAYIAMVRGDAIRFQEPMGVFFFLDPVTQQTTMCEVQEITVPFGSAYSTPPGYNYTQNYYSYWDGPLNWIDIAGTRTITNTAILAPSPGAAGGYVTPYRESLTLPPGVGVGLYNSPLPYTTATAGGYQGGEAYIDTTGIGLVHPAADQLLRMGVIFFDATGAVICVDYGVPDYRLWPVNDELGKKILPGGGYLMKSAENLRGNGGSTISSTGFYIYDRIQYLTQQTTNSTNPGLAFNEADMMYTPSFVTVPGGFFTFVGSSSSPSASQICPAKIDEENWIIQNGIPLTVNPSDGTLMKGK